MLSACDWSCTDLSPAEQREGGSGAGLRGDCGVGGAEESSTGMVYEEPCSSSSTLQTPTLVEEMVYPLFPHLMMDDCTLCSVEMFVLQEKECAY